MAFAMPAAMFSVMWPDVRDRFDQSLGTLGLISLAYGLGRMASSGSGRVATTRFGIGPCFIGGLIGLVAVDLVLAMATSWVLFLLGVAGVGLVSGLLDSVGAGVVATLGSVGDAGLIHGAYGVGATIGPLVVALVDDWRLSLAVAALFACGALALAVSARSAWPAPPRNVARAPDGAPPVGPTALSLAAFLVFVGLEVTMGQWVFTYLTEGRSISDGLAAVAVSGFWGGTMAGRLALASPAIRVRVERVGLTAFALIAGVGALSTMVAPWLAVVVSTVITGIALAPMVPTLSAHTADRVGAAHAQHVAGWQLLSANVGAIGFPSATGWIVDTTGPIAIIIVVLALLAAGVPVLIATMRLH